MSRRTARFGVGSNQHQTRPPDQPREPSDTAVPAAPVVADDPLAEPVDTAAMLRTLDGDAHAVRAAKHRAEWTGAHPHEEAERIARGRARATELLGDAPMFVHFTDESGARGIVASGRLQTSRNHADMAYAVAVGGEHVPGVQRGTESERGFGHVVGGRKWAVVFTAPVPPDTVHPEECVWTRHDHLELADAQIVAADDAVGLLDGSLNLPDWFDA